MSRSANVTEILLNGKDPDRIALRTRGGDCTYGELFERCGQVARWLLEAGGQKGDRVILISDNSLFWVTAYLGVMRSGLICVPLPPNSSNAELRFVLKKTHAKFVFAQSQIAVRAGSEFESLQLVTGGEALPIVGAASQRSFEALCREATDRSHPLPSTSGDDLAALMFTSGSTGQPRGVMVSHGNILSNTESIIEYLGLSASDRMMVVLPFHYCFGTSLLHTHLMAGGELVLDSGFMYSESFLRRMVETECTGFAGVPSHYQLLLRSSGLPRMKFPHLRHVQQAGGCLAPVFLRELIKALPGVQIFIMYGQTEATARLSYLPPSMLQTKIGSIGKGMPGVELRVVNDHGGDVLPGEVGEVVANGANVARGYWCEPQESAVVFRDGLLYTGDLATVDEDGYIFIVDRARDFLKCGGKRVSCRQIEEQLLVFRELQEAAVIGIPDAVLGEAVKAFVVSRHKDHNGLPEQVLSFCKSHLPPQQVPKEIVVLSSLPKNSAGKVLKSRLKGLAAGPA